MMSWSGARVSHKDRRKFSETFSRIVGEENNSLSKEVAMGIINNMAASIPMEDVAKIWELSDADKDQRLTAEEYTIALFLVQKRVDGWKLPETLPESLLDEYSSDKEEEQQPRKTWKSSDELQVESEKVEPTKDILPPVKYKLAVLGGQYGKSSYLLQFLNNTFEEGDDTPTLEYTFHKKFDYDGEECNLEILDTSGDDSYHNLRVKWYQFGDGFILLYDVTNKTSVEEMEAFLKELIKCRGANIPYVMVGTKVDSPKRLVSRGLGLRMAAKKSRPYFDISAKTGYNVERSIRSIIALIKDMKSRAQKEVKAKALKKMGIKPDPKWNNSENYTPEEFDEEDNIEDPEPLIPLQLSNFHVELGSKSTGTWKIEKMLIRGGMQYYQHYLYSTDHSNYVAGSVEDPVVITVEENCKGKKPRVIVRTVEEDQLLRLPSSIEKSEEKRLQLFRVLCPEANITTIKLAPSSPTVKANLISIEKLPLASQLKHKFGLLYCAKGQKTEAEMMGNEHGSAEFEEFLEFIGSKVELAKFPGFKGGLNPPADGTHTYHKRIHDHEVVFHVSTMLAHRDNDPQQLQKKRHIGNDAVVIVYKEGDQLFDPTVIKSQFTHVYFVVQKVQKPIVGYKVAVASRDGVSLHLPLLPSSPVFPAVPNFVDFLLTKLINAEQACQTAYKFQQRHTRSRKTLLSAIITEAETTE